MKYFRQLISAISVVILLNTVLFAQELKLNITPDPVEQNGQLRITLYSDQSLKESTVSIDGLRSQEMRNIGNNLFTVNMVIPSNFQTGPIKGKVELIDIKNKELIIPFQFSVTKASTFLDKPGQTFTSNPTDALNQRIKALEDLIKNLRNNNRNLKDSIKAQEDKLKNLENQNRSQNELDLEEDALNQLKKQLENQENLLRSQQTDLEDQLNSLLKKENRLNEKAKELEAQESKLKEKENELDEKIQDLNETADKLSEKENTLASQEERIKSQEIANQTRANELQIERRRLQQLEQTIDNQKENLGSELLSVKNQHALLTSRETEIESQRAQLLNQEKQLQEREAALISQQKGEKVKIIELKNQIQEDRENLKSQFIVLESKSKLINSEKNALSQQQLLVNQQLAKIKQKENELVSVNRRIIQGQEKLRTEQAQIQALKLELDNQLKVTEIERNKLSTQQQELISQRDEYKAKSEELDSLKNDLLDSKQSYIEEKELYEKKSEVLEAENANLREEFQVSGQKYTQLEEQVETLELSLVNSKTENDELSGIINHYKEELDSLDLYYQTQIEHLKSIINDAKDKNNELEELNAKLLFNQKLIGFMKEPQPDYQVGFSPYIGYRLLSETGFSNGFELGLGATGYLKEGWAIEGRIGALQGASASSSGSSVQSTTILTGAISRSFLFVDTVQLTAKGGLSYAKSGSNSITSPYLGSAIFFDLEEDLRSFIELSYGPGIFAAFGIEKRFNFFDKAENTLTPQAKYRYSTRLEVQPIIEIDSIKDSYIEFKDIETHWVKSVVELPLEAQTIHYLKEEQNSNNVTLSPNETISFKQAAYSLVKAQDYHPNKVIAVPINFTIKGLADTSYIVRIDLINDQSSENISIVSDDEFYSGVHREVWQLKTSSGNFIATGNYTLRLTVREKDIDLSEHGAQLIPGEVIGESDARLLVVSGKPGKSITPKENDIFTPVIAEAKKLDIFTQPKSWDATINRIEFINSVARLMIINGAESKKAIPDLRVYSDSENLSLESRKLLDIYVTELGYGGDDQKRLRPFDPLKRSEKIVILNRFLEWKTRRQNR